MITHASQLSLGNCYLWARDTSLARPDGPFDYISVVQDWNDAPNGFYPWLTLGRSRLDQMDGDCVLFLLSGELTAFYSFKDDFVPIKKMPSQTIEDFCLHDAWAGNRERKKMLRTRGKDLYLEVASAPSVRSVEHTHVMAGSILRGRCHFCIKKPSKGKLKNCIGCKTAAYCSTECQAAHWKYHKRSCQGAGEIFPVDVNDPAHVQLTARVQDVWLNVLAQFVY